ncbi:MAG: hypothetical protein QOG66_3245, partial [Methylobacteriaceae bacterium]|nr:hypothetical protein [Methylobacteriaceae bacterium]
ARIGRSSASFFALGLTDGTVLARFPIPDHNIRIDRNGPVGQTIVASPNAGLVTMTSPADGIERRLGYQRLAEYPVYVSAGLDTAAIRARWLATMSQHLIFGVPATALLFLILLLAFRRTRHLYAEATRRLEAEEALKHGQRLEALGQLTGGVAHDFNNLLTAIVGNLDIISRAPDNSSRVERLARSALQAASRGGELTQKLLAFARKEVIQPETVNPNHLLNDFRDLLQRALGETIDLEIQLDATLDPVRLDPAQFQSAVLNLCVNARDAMQQGGKLKISTRNMRIGDESSVYPDARPGAYVVVSIADSGGGMEAGTLARAFEPFFTTKDAGSGTGLGLSQVYGFCRQTGGFARITSNVGHGTTVEMYLPRSHDRPERATGGLVLPLRRAAEGEVILVVEDDSAVLEMAVESLNDLGYQTLTAADAHSALSILRSNSRIDMLFSDVVMPGGMNGVQLSVEAKRLRPELKVLLSSGYTGAALGSSGVPEDMPILNKPYRREDLAKKLRTVLSRD